MVIFEFMQIMNSFLRGSNHSARLITVSPRRNAAEPRKANLGCGRRRTTKGVLMSDLMEWILTVLCILPLHLPPKPPPQPKHH
jgi:hypothetical protein